MLSESHSLRPISQPERAMRVDVGQPVDAVKAAERAAEVVRAAKRLVESEAERERVAHVSGLVEDDARLGGGDRH